MLRRARTSTSSSGSRRASSIDGRRTAPADVQLREGHRVASGRVETLLSIVIHEGRNRQVRKMCDAIGHPVVRLRRVPIGPITDERLRPGEFRELDAGGSRGAARRSRPRRRAARRRSRTSGADRRRRDRSVPRTSVQNGPAPTPTADAARSTSAWVMSGVASEVHRHAARRAAFARAARDSTAGITLSSAPCSR